jgi:UDP-N-acetyl-D-galactosamine dehydrogenase
MRFNVAILGLGYVGLPLAAEFSKYHNVTGYDLDKSRINELKKGYDRTNEVLKKKIYRKLEFTDNKNLLQNKDIFIITVPTPIKKNKKPDLKYLLAASKTVAKYLKKNSIVIYESTVFPGCTEEICLPILEKISGLRLNKDFYIGYSPERINPGKNKQKLSNTVKIVSASNKYSLKILKKFYGKIIKAGIHVVKTIKEAEAAKVIENIQRDINIALINECSVIFKKLNLDTSEILKAAETKWNFASYKPGLVGGHCIGVDPYYLTYIANKINYKPRVILAGRKVNNSMSSYVAKSIINTFNNNQSKFYSKKKILILGISFKENCSDIRNSMVFDIINILQKKKILTHVYDPIANRSELERIKKISLIKNLNKSFFYDIIVLAVPHSIFIKMGIKKIKSLGKKDVKIFDLKSVYPKNQTYWQL